MVDRSLAVVAVAAPIREQVLRNLRRAIVEGEFAPGQRLVEREIIELTGASRTSVREALRELATEGLITTVPHRGVFVAVPTVADAEELYAVRQVLEALAVGWFVDRATPSDVDELWRALEALEAATSIREALRAKDRFYLVIGSHNATVSSLLSVLNARIALLRSLSLSAEGRMPESKREMREIVDAIARRDRDAAEAAARRHVERSGQLAIEALARQAQQTEESKA
jgi:DNA-binding GntR family transcriptional regulator